MKPGMANLRAIVEMAPPKTYTEIRRFTGKTGFFRRFIKGYAKIAKPLNDLLEGEASKLKSEELEVHDSPGPGICGFPEAVPAGN